MWMFQAMRKKTTKKHLKWCHGLIDWTFLGNVALVFRCFGWRRQESERSLNITFYRVQNVKEGTFTRRKKGLQLFFKESENSKSLSSKIIYYAKKVFSVMNGYWYFFLVTNLSSYTMATNLCGNSLKWFIKKILLHIWVTLDVTSCLLIGFSNLANKGGSYFSLAPFSPYEQELETLQMDFFFWTHYKYIV